MAYPSADDPFSGAEFTLSGAVASSDERLTRNRRILDELAAERARTREAAASHSPRMSSDWPRRNTSCGWLGNTNRDLSQASPQPPSGSPRCRGWPTGVSTWRPFPP